MLASLWRASSLTIVLLIRFLRGTRVADGKGDVQHAEASNRRWFQFYVQYGSQLFSKFILRRKVFHFIVLVLR